LKLRTLLHQDIGIDSYVVITQGQNFIASKGMVHINRMRNHLGMLSFGPPFASLFAIDDTVKGLNISEKRSLYIEKLFYDSLNDKSILDKSTLIRRNFLCPFLKTANEFIAVNLYEVEQQDRDVSSMEEVARDDN
jgi:hypothetical protein